MAHPSNSDRSAVTRRSDKKTLRGRSSSSKRRLSRTVATILAEAPRAPMPRNVRPMLATLVDQPFDRNGWIFEPKWDGYRAIAEIRKSGVDLYSRNHKTFAVRFAPIVRALENLGHEAVLDGEIVAVDHQGRAQFQLLQNYAKDGQGQLLYYVFDLLHLDGHDLRRLPLVRRKAILAAILGNLGEVRLSEHIEERGDAFFEAARAHHLEGIVAKDGQSVYAEGSRSRDWLKIKTQRRQEAVIAGFTEPRGSRKALGALILGVYEGGNLVYIGHTGGGFDTRGLADARARLEPLVRTTCPFQMPPRTNAPVRWVEPKLVCEIKFQEWTTSGVARQPIFIAYRDDKPARQIRREEPAPVAKVLPETASQTARARGPQAS